MAQPSASDRRHSVRTGVAWDGVRAVLDDAGAQARIVDVGGGTGGFAVPLAELGHRVQVIEPSPDALASRVAPGPSGRRGSARGRDQLFVPPFRPSHSITPPNTRSTSPQSRLML